MNVVSCSVDDQRDSVFVANRAAEVLMRSGTNFWRQPGFAPLRREDDVIEQIAIGGTHAAAGFRRPSSGACFFLDYTRSSASLHSGLNSTAPSGCYRAVASLRIQRRRREGTQPYAPPRILRSGARFGGFRCGCGLAFSAGGATEYSPECSAAKLREPHPPNSPTPAKGWRNCVSPR